MKSQKQITEHAVSMQQLDQFVTQFRQMDSRLRALEMRPDPASALDVLSAPVTGSLLTKWVDTYHATPPYGTNVSLPASGMFVYGYLLGGGGGGGSGVSGPNATAKSGGSGGGGGDAFVFIIPIWNIRDLVLTITAGAGGPGGAAVNAGAAGSNTPGLPGTDGGYTAVSWSDSRGSPRAFYAGGGKGGIGGTITSAVKAGGQGGGLHFTWYNYILGMFAADADHHGAGGQGAAGGDAAPTLDGYHGEWGGGGGGASIGDNVQAGHGGHSTFGAGGGGAGEGFDNSGNQGTYGDGGDGSGSIGSSSDGGDGHDNYEDDPGWYTGGGGGAGGGAANGGPGTAGGDGGLYGGGGGGGGAVQTGTQTSGKGGDGADGIAIIFVV